jgi:hypothetical protein
MLSCMQRLNRVKKSAIVLWRRELKHVFLTCEGNGWNTDEKSPAGSWDLGSPEVVGNIENANRVAFVTFKWVAFVTIIYHWFCTLDKFKMSYLDIIKWPKMTWNLKFSMWFQARLEGAKPKQRFLQPRRMAMTADCVGDNDSHFPAKNQLMVDHSVYSTPFNPWWIVVERTSVNWWLVKGKKGGKALRWRRSLIHRWMCASSRSQFILFSFMLLISWWGLYEMVVEVRSFVSRRSACSRKRPVRELRSWNFQNMPNLEPDLSQAQPTNTSSHILA